MGSAFQFRHDFWWLLRQPVGVQKRSDCWSHGGDTGFTEKKVWSHDRSQSLSDLQSVGEDICSPPKTLLELDFRVTVLSPRGREMVQVKDLFSSVDVVEERLGVVIGPVQQSGKLESDPGVQILVEPPGGSQQGLGLVLGLWVRMCLLMRAPGRCEAH